MNKNTFAILALIVVLLLIPGSVLASKSSPPPPPTVQMLSSSYSNIQIFQNTFATVETLSFSVSQPAKLEVTSLNAAINADASTAWQCEVNVDGLTLAASPSMHDSADITVTDGNIMAGNHTLVVACEFNLSGSMSGDFGSVSAIVTTGL